MANEIIEPVTHLEKVFSGQEEPITHLEKIIALYCGSGGSGSSRLTADLISNVEVGGVLANTEYTKDTSLDFNVKLGL